VILECATSCSSMQFWGVGRTAPGILLFLSSLVPTVSPGAVSGPYTGGAVSGGSGSAGSGGSGSAGGGAVTGPYTGPYTGGAGSGGSGSAGSGGSGSAGSGAISRDANAVLDIVVSLPDDQIAKGIATLTNSTLSDVNDATNNIQSVAAQTPQGRLGIGGGVAPSVNRGFPLASQGSGVLLATVLGIAVLIAAVFKQRWAGEQASDLLQQGDALLADDE